MGTRGSQWSLCSGNGNLAVWPDFTGSDAVATQRIAGTVTALTAAAAPGLGPGAFLACAATSDAALHRLEGAPGGSDGLQTSVRRLSPLASAGPTQQ